MQEAALELSLPVVLVGGLAVPGCEAAGGGALSGVVSGFAADVVARRRHLASQSSGLVCGREDGEMPLLDVVEEVFAAVAGGPGSGTTRLIQQ